MRADDLDSDEDRNENEEAPTAKADAGTPSPDATAIWPLFTRTMGMALVYWRQLRNGRSQS